MAIVITIPEGEIAYLEDGSIVQFLEEAEAEEIEELEPTSAPGSSRGIDVNKMASFRSPRAQTRAPPRSTRQSGRSPSEPIPTTKEKGVIPLRRALPRK